MDVVSGGIWRYPEASAETIDGTWWVRLAGTPELVLPRGPLPDDDYDLPPKKLTHTLHEVCTDLEHLLGLGEREAALHLAHHCRLYGAPDLCGPHGLPVWHSHPERATDRHGRRRTTLQPSCPIGEFPGSADPGLRAGDVVKLIEFTNAVIQLAHHVTTRRTPAQAWLADAILGYGLISPALSRHLADASRAGVSSAQGRHLVRAAVNAAMTSSGLNITSRWERERRPELALAARTTTALYVADLQAHIGMHAPDRSVVCSVCVRPVTLQRTPRKGDAVYCRRTECQRERNRLNQARWRERRQGDGQYREET